MTSAIVLILAIGAVLEAVAALDFRNAFVVLLASEALIRTFGAILFVFAIRTVVET